MFYDILVKLLIFEVTSCYLYEVINRAIVTWVPDPLIILSLTLYITFLVAIRYSQLALEKRAVTDYFLLPIIWKSVSRVFDTWNGNSCLHIVIDQIYHVVKKFRSLNTAKICFSISKIFHLVGYDHLQHLQPIYLQFLFVNWFPLPALSTSHSTSHSTVILHMLPFLRWGKSLRSTITTYHTTLHGWKFCMIL